MLWELIRKDLRIFFSDRRAMIISFAVPVAIASFMAIIFGSMGASTPTTKIRLLIADEDRSPVSEAFLANLANGPLVKAEATTNAGARTAVRNGDAPVALIVPK